ncbi:TPA: hypothetical protein ACLANO_002048, partial [Neisseria meningitidis]
DKHIIFNIFNWIIVYLSKDNCLFLTNKWNQRIVKTQPEIKNLPDFFYLSLKSERFGMVGLFFQTYRRPADFV